MRILLFGRDGQLGWQLQRCVSPLGKLMAIDKEDLDLAQKDELVNLIREYQPDVILNAAAYTAVDKAESEAEIAFAVNRDGPAYLALSCAENRLPLIHISTDAVFDGRRGNYSEADKPSPISVYGKTKLHAEHEVLSIHPFSSVIRTNIYGWNKRDKFSLAEWMLNKLENNDELPAFKDIIYSPIIVNDLIVQLFVLYDKKFSGTIHLLKAQRNLPGFSSCPRHKRNGHPPGERAKPVHYRGGSHRHLEILYY